VRSTLRDDAAEVIHELASISCKCIAVDIMTLHQMIPILDFEANEVTGALTLINLAIDDNACEAMLTSCMRLKTSSQWRR